ncbi:octaprenyl-diphosphate synthase [Nocardia tenerifensis]|uniref:Octaprenyl-diphosphate synthase n=1 Tax=Nocardia tenerifensis TaxID=228006 RepID=A0A318KHQ2_9NOCA|nr:polyprenyl synthetase family protein [Nocardia tenerifensis]PXX71782.1 octaprenyl-diphosphate synthase [Nocardia tenerifensis]
MENPTSPPGHRQLSRLAVRVEPLGDHAPNGSRRPSTVETVAGGHPAIGQVDTAAPRIDRPAAITERLLEILVTGGEFDDIYRHVLAAPGKRVRAGLLLACAHLLPDAEKVPLSDAVDLACVMEMFHESSLVHDDICDGSLLRRDAPSVPAAFGIRTAARAGFHLAGKALQVMARVLADNPAVFARLGEVPGVTYLDQLSDLSFGQLVETLPPAVDDAALRRHYELVAGAKTGTLFRLSCSYGGTAGGLDDEGLRAVMRYAEQLALAFQIMDDVRDVEGDAALGKDACGDLERRVLTWPVIEWLARRPESRELWFSEQTSSAVLQAELMHSGATRAAHDAAVRAAETARGALEVFPPSAGRDHLCDLATRVVSR